MKSLRLFAPQFQIIEISFSEWLEYQNYSESAVKNYTAKIKELLHYLEQHQTTRPEEITSKQIEDFIESIKQRPNQTKGGGLSNQSINYTIKSINRFCEYLRLTKGILLEPSLKREKVEQKEIQILTREEMERLFEATIGDHPIDKRSQAILSIFYGAGLRRSEVENLKVHDVSFDRNQLFINQAKGNKDRIVPVPESVIRIIKTYITECRDIFEDASEYTEDYLFIEITGKRMSPWSYDQWLKKLIQRSELDKHITLHTFRHTLATHLLQSGMKLEDIAQLLGHSSLDSTMIYTHYV